MRLEAESYGDHETAQFINEHFVPFTVNLHEKAGLFGRFHVGWTPTILVMTPRGVEAHRIEGYHPRAYFVAELKMGLARVTFLGKQFGEAEQIYDEVAQGYEWKAAEALYWRAVCRYSASGNAEPLMQVARELRERHSQSIWSVKASVWEPAAVAR